VGYGGFSRVFPEAHIMNIAVDPSFRGRGAGKKLLSAILKSAKKLGLGEITLEAAADNTAAIALYEKAGFKREGVRPRYYHDKKDAYIYWLR